MTVVTLPAGTVPATAQIQLIDYGFILRPPTGAPATKINRPGSRYSAVFTMPPMTGASARVFIARLQRAKRDGIRLALPLAGVAQGSPGTPVCDGAASGGTALALRGMTPGYVVTEGYWMSVIDAAGVYYLHQVNGSVTVDAAGKATVPIEPPLRKLFADGNTVILDAPQFEGLVTSDATWTVGAGGLVSDMAFTVEEAA